MSCFSQPFLLLTLGTLPLLVVLWFWSDWKRERRWQRFVAPDLRDSLVVRPKSSHLWRSRIAYLCGLAACFCALAGPRWGKEIHAQLIPPQAVMLILDVSRSMLAKDENPSRLEAAKLAAKEMSQAFTSHRFGLIAFAGEAYLFSPLSPDSHALRQSIDFLSPDAFPQQGTDLAQALKICSEHLDPEKNQHPVAVLLSDGESHGEDAQNALHLLQKQGIPVHVVLCGSDQGSRIPDASSDSGFLKDAQGAEVLSRPNRASLSQVTTSTGGQLFALSELPQLIEKLHSQVGRDQGDAAIYRYSERPAPRFAWFLFPGLLCLLLGAFFQSPSKTARLHPFLLTLAALLGSFTPADAQSLSPKEARAAFTEGLKLASSDFRLARQAFSNAMLSPESEIQATAQFNFAILSLRQFHQDANHYDPQGRWSPKSDLATLRQLAESAIQHLRAAEKSLPRLDTESQIFLAQEYLAKLPKDKNPSKAPENPDPINKNPDQNPDPSCPKKESPNTPAPQASPPEPKAGETPEQSARRILEENTEAQAPKIPKKSANKPDASSPTW